MTTKTKRTRAQLQVRNTRRAAHVAFVGGAVASLAANVYASQHTFVGWVVGAWPALALLASVYLYENAPKVWWMKGSLALIIAGAAWASYWHLVHVIANTGADTVTTYVLPLTVDAMMGIAQAVLKHVTWPPSRPSTRRKATPANVRQLRTKTA